MFTRDRRHSKAWDGDKHRIHATASNRNLIPPNRGSEIRHPTGLPVLQQCRRGQGSAAAEYVRRYHQAAKG